MQFVIAIVLMIASAVITAMTTRGPKKPQPAFFSDFQTPQNAEGTPQAVIFGDVWVDDWMVLWFGNYYYDPIYATKKGK
jgi:hypothetical protein